MISKKNNNSLTTFYATHLDKQTHKICSTIGNYLTPLWLSFLSVKWGINSAYVIELL